MKLPTTAVGKCLYALMEEYNYTPDDLDIQFKLDHGSTRRILLGEDQITEIIAYNLEDLFGLPHSVWLSIVESPIEA